MAFSTPSSDVSNTRDGIVELVAHIPRVNPASFWIAPASCQDAPFIPVP